MQCKKKSQYGLMFGAVFCVYVQKICIWIMPDEYIYINQQ